MAVLTKQQRREQGAVTPKGLEAAKEEAVRLCEIAYAPHPVKQPDGTSLMLCWNGRIVRGYERLAAARIARDAKTIDVLTKAIAGLEGQYNEAARAAERAASTWAAMAATAGATVNATDCYPPACQCEGCALQRTLHDHNEARGAYSDALYALMAPNGQDIPPILTILAGASEVEQRDRLWTYLRRIRDTGDTYIEACKQAGVRPNWRAAMFPGETD